VTGHEFDGVVLADPAVWFLEARAARPRFVKALGGARARQAGVDALAFGLEALLQAPFDGLFLARAALGPAVQAGCLAVGQAGLMGRAGGPRRSRTVEGLAKPGDQARHLLA
jgi:hypothetical protein